MLGVPHWIFLIGVLGLRIGFEHFSELPGAVVGLLDAQPKQELDLDDDVILLNISMEGMFLQDLIIRSFSRLAELAGSVHPPPEVLSRSYDVVGDVVEDIVEFIVSWIGGEVGMLVVGLDLEERVAFSGRSDWLVDQSLEGNEGAEDHLEEGVVDAPLPVVVILLHYGRGFGTRPQHELLDALEELIADYLVFFGEFADGLVHVLVRVRAEFGGTERRFFPCLEIEVLEDDCLLDAPDDIFDHS